MLPDHGRGDLRFTGTAQLNPFPSARFVAESAPEFSGVDCKGLMAAIAHNEPKAVRRLGERTGTPKTFVSG